MSTPTNQVDFAREVAALKRNVQKLLRQLDTPVGEFDLTVDQFCAKHKMSRAGFYKMMARGRGPRTIKNGGLVRITAEDDRAWTERWSSAQED